MPDDLSSQVNLDTQAAQAMALAMQAAREDAQRRADARAMRDTANAEVANARAASQPFVTTSARYSAGVITAPADAGASFDSDAFEAMRRTGQPLAGQPGPTPAAGGPSAGTPYGPPPPPGPDPRGDAGKYGRVDSGFVRGATFEDTSAPWYADPPPPPPGASERVSGFYARATGFFRDRYAAPETGSAPPPRYADYESARQAEADILGDARNQYTASGRYNEIGGEQYNREVQEARVSAGLATESAAPHGEGGGMGLAFGLGYSAMQIGGGIAQMQRLNAGQYVTPEQRDAASASAFAPGVGGLIGTVAGEAFGPAGGLVGQFAGQAAGQVYAATIGAGDERSQTAREMSDQLRAATNSLKDFSGQILNSGVAVQSLQAGLTSAGSLGNFGAGTLPGVTSLTASFGQYAPQDWAAIARYGGQPLNYTLGSRIASGAGGSADIAALGYDAAESGDFAGLKTLQQASRDARLKDDPAAVAARREIEKDSSGALSPVYDAEDRLGISNKRSQARIRLHNREAQLAADPDTDAQSALADQFARLRVDDLTAQSGIQGDQAGVSLARLRGGSAADVAAAGAPLLGSLQRAGAAARAEAAQYTADLNTPEGKARADELNVKIADADARAAGFDVTASGFKRDNFAQGLGEEQSGFGLAVTRARLEGRSAEDIYAQTARQSAFLEGQAGDLNNPISPTERDALRQSALTSRYQAQQDVYSERLQNLGNATGAAQTGVDTARAFGTGGQIDAALGTEAAAVAGQIAELTRELRTGGQTAADYRREQGELNQANAQAVQIAAQRRDERVSNDYAVSGDRLSGDVAGLSRRIRVGGIASVDDGALDRDYEGILGADQDAVNAYAPGTRQRADADAKLARDRADQADQRDRLNAYTPDARTRTADTLGDLDVSRAEHAFHRAQESPYSDAGADPFARAGQLEGALGRGERRLTADFGRETAFRQQRMAEGKWDDLAEEGYEDDYARYQDRSEGLKDRRADLEHDKLEAFFGALPEGIAGGRGLSAGVQSALVPTAALSALYSPNAGVGSWGGRRTATWWRGSGEDGDSPYGHAEGGDDPGAAASAGGGASEQSRYLAIIADGITVLKDHVTTGGGHAFGPSVPSHGVASVAQQLGYDLNPRTH